jgi:DUF218 domain
MRHTIHCSGYNLAERSPHIKTKNRQGKIIEEKFFDWDVVCLGDHTRGLLGRITMCIRLAECLRPECVIWSTGATYQSGASEAQIMMGTALDYLTSQNQPIDWLKSISVIEQESSNTLTSMHVAAEMVSNRFGADEVMLHLVTSDNHAPRIARDAAVAFHPYQNVILSVVPAHTSYGGKSPSQVTIHELSPERVAS